MTTTLTIGKQHQIKKTLDHSPRASSLTRARCLYHHRLKASIACGDIPRVPKHGNDLFQPTISQQIAQDV
jgi:hypothetical protein